eukprot:NODE_235_length_13458_cov_0.279737.p8 type:complete len:232 gc:universal NODE_235_length_13458_cov_0.279737:7086-6391(-)
MAYINTNHPDFIGVGAAMQGRDTRDPIQVDKQHKQRVERSRSPQPRSPNFQTNASGNINNNNLDFSSNSTVLGLDEIESDEQKESLLQYFFKKRDLKPVNNRKSMIPNPNDGFSLSTLPTAVPGIITPNQFTHHQELTEKEQFEVQLIRRLMISYFEIVRQSLLDLVPKAIMHNLVNGVTKELHPTLVESLYKPDKIKELFMEDELIVKEREKVKQVLEKYKKANEVLANI